MKYLLTFGVLSILITGFIAPTMVEQSLDYDKRLVYEACLYGYNTGTQTNVEKAGQVCKNLVKLVYGDLK